MKPEYKGEWVWINPKYRKGQRMKKPRRSRRIHRHPGRGFFRGLIDGKCPVGYEHGVVIDKDGRMWTPNPAYETAQYEMGKDMNFYLREGFK
jgi:hypothetical protein